MGEVIETDMSLIFDVENGNANEDAMPEICRN